MGDTEESYESAPLLPIGDQRYLCVEYPGYVKSLKRALDTMGGEKALAQAIQNETPVELSFRKSDIFSHSIKGDILPSTRLLVKVTRRVKRHIETGEIVEEDTEDWKTEVMGSVTKTLRFRGMADFQRIVPKTDPIVELKQSILSGNTETMLNFNLDEHPDRYMTHVPPPIFSIVEVPFSYNYRQNAPVVRVRVKQPDGSYKIKLINRARPNAREATFIYFNDEKIPNQPWHKLHEITDPSELETKELIAKLYEERPIWTKFGLINMLPKKYEKYVSKVLPFFGYIMNDGPWRECWVKYGIDVRKDKKYAIYQVLSVRRNPGSEKTPEKKVKRTELLSTFTVQAKNDPRATGANNNAEDDVPAKKHIIDGVNPPGKKFFFQLCDILDPDVIHIINNKDYIKDKADKTYGYYYTCVFNRIRDVCKTKQTQFLDKGKADPIPDADEGLKEAVLKEQSGVSDTMDDDVNEKERNELKDIERAARVATSNMQKPNASKRLKDVVDDYMNHLESHTGDFTNDMADHDVLEEDYEDEDFDEDFDIYEEGVDPFGDNEETNKDDPMEED